MTISGKELGLDVLGLTGLSQVHRNLSIDDLIEDNYNETIVNATIIKNGVILDDRINQYQKRI